MGSGGYPCCCQNLPGSPFIGSMESFPTVFCPCCRNNIAPLRFQITVSGIFPGTVDPCADCDNLNGVYVLEFNYNAGPGCVWELTFDSVCGYTRAALSLVCFAGPGLAVIIITFTLSGPGVNTLTFQASDTVATIDCMECFTLGSFSESTPCSTRDPLDPTSGAEAEVCPVSFEDNCRDCCGETELPTELIATVDGLTAGCAGMNGAYLMSFDGSDVLTCDGDGPTHDEPCKWWSQSNPSATAVMTMTCTEITITLDFYLYDCSDPPSFIHWRATTPAGNCDDFHGLVLAYVDDTSSCPDLAGTTVTLEL